MTSPETNGTPPTGTIRAGSTVVIDGVEFAPLIDPAAVAGAVARIAAELSTVYAQRRPVVIGVLNGAAPFHADLIRLLDFPIEVDYLRASSYRGEMTAETEAIITAPVSTHLTDRNVIVVEDIVDTGVTVKRIVDYLKGQGAASVAVATFLHKQRGEPAAAAPDYVGYAVPDLFVVGYGLDYHGYGRNLGGIYAIKSVDRLTTLVDRAVDEN